MQTRSLPIRSAASALCAMLLAPLTQAGTTNHSFSFQQGDLQKDGSPYGAGGSYAGVLDGHIVDANTTGTLTANATATIGNQFQSQTNGRNFIGLFSYDLTELADFITANTSGSSSATITSVSFKIVASGNTAGGAHAAISLYRTDPFSSAATWPTADGTNAWTDPYQSGRGETQFNYTGGGSALTANLGGTSPSTASKTAGSIMEWTTSANFVAALNDALAQPDKTLYLMAARVLQNSDGRVPINTSNATTVDDRPELIVTVAVSTLSDWTGAVDTSWTNSGNWTTPPATGDNIRFNSSSTANLATVLNTDFDLNGIAVIDPTGPVAIGGANTLTLGIGGIDLSAANQDLDITAPLALSDTQIWSISSGRTLGISGPMSGAGPLTIFGAGKVSTGAANILANGAGAGNLTVDGTLDLNGFSQSINGLSGSGTVQNTAAGALTLTVGNNDASGAFSGDIQETGGALTLVKTGTGSLTLTGDNTYSGGFTNDDAGSIAPNSNSAFGTGPVVFNAGRIYATATTTFANSLALNNSDLRIGGGNNRTITWNGPVDITGTSSLRSDGGTGGITVNGEVTLATGTVLTSFANGTTHTINGDISGTGVDIDITAGTLQLGGTNSHTGTTTVGSATTLRLLAGGTLSSANNLVVNGNFNIRSTVGMVYGGTITGDGSGTININEGANVELAGPISGMASINANNGFTNANLSGDISGATNVLASGANVTLTLGGNNTYTGITSATNGTLVLASTNAIPDASSVTLGNGTLETTAIGSETAGTLTVSGAATINLASGANLAFADSSALEADWTGTLDLTGAFVSGQSLRFGSSNTALTGIQLGQITADGLTNFGLDADGFLTADVAGSPYDTFASQIADENLRGRDDDADGDGFTNLQEFLFGTSPIASNGSISTTEKSGANLIIRWKELQTGATYALLQSATLNHDWVAAVGATVEDDGAPTGDYQPRKATVAIGSGKLFFQVEGTEN